jgi:hypothetical protein
MGTALATGPDNVLRVLSELETLPAEANGALAFGDGTCVSGVVLLEQGRVCWAAAHGLRRRLTDHLRDACDPPLDTEEVEQLVHACRSGGKPVGEALVAMGRLTPEGLRAALLHHTAECLAAGEHWTAPARWVPHRARGYQSAYTFRPLELLTYASAVQQGPQRATWAEAQLRGIAGGRCAAVFDGEGRTLLGCLLPNDRATSLRTLRAAGGWAAESFCEEGFRSPMLKFTRDRAGAIWIGWRDQGHTFLVQSPDRDDFSRFLRSLQPLGWTAAVHSSVPLVEPQVAAT